MHKRGNSGLPALLFISFVQIWQFLHVWSRLPVLLVICLVQIWHFFSCLESISKTVLGNQLKFEILIAGNDRVRSINHYPYRSGFGVYSDSHYIACKY